MRDLTRAAETSINLHIDVDGQGEADVETGIGFLDHMISQLCKFSRMSVWALAWDELLVPNCMTGT